MVSTSSSSSSTAVAPQSFALDRNIFNESLYTNIRSFWFAGIPPGSKHGNAESLKRWWGAGGRTEEESLAFDSQCRENYGSILETISPSRLALPRFTSYEDERRRVEDIAAPFLAELKTGKDNNAAERLLSLAILLDQIPRNIYRDPKGLQLVYNHYDRLAWSLIHSAATLVPNPLDHPSSRGNIIVKNWLALPLMHAEDLASQDLGISRVEGCLAEAKEDGDEETVKEIEFGMKAARDHLEIITRFGRFPHRNESLGRRSTGEEEEWLKTGETFGVKQGQKGKDEPISLLR